MQKIVFFLLFVFSGITSFSQQEFFVYIQADNLQPFYARVHTKIYSSTENGYMIIPKLGDSSYEFIIGFAKNAFPEQKFTVAINKKDKGFQLKNLGEKGWALVNLQNTSVIMNTGVTSKTSPEFSGTRKTDTFSEMLANVVNDSAILYSAVKPKPQEIVPEKKTPVIVNQPENNVHEIDSAKITVPILQPKNDNLVKKEDSVSKANNLIAEAPAKKAEPPATSVTSPKEIVINKDTSKVIDSNLPAKSAIEKPFITRIEEKNTEGAYQAVYLEQYNFSTDTIKISIPLTEGVNANTIPAAPIIEKKNESVPEQKNSIEEKAPVQKPVVIDSAASAKRGLQIVNSDCKVLATDYDVDKLRVKLISDKTIDDKLATSKKYFKTKCLSVKQVRALTELFPSDETKYRFFDISYPYVSDTGNFYQLEELIESSYYKNRFKAMLIK